MSTENKHDDLELLLALYHQAQQQQPPARLDQRILAEARKTVVITSLPVKKTHRPRWSAPLALAATLALGVGLVTLVQHEFNLQERLDSSDFQNQNSPPAAAKPEPALRSAPVAPSPAPAEFQADSSARTVTESAVPSTTTIPAEALRLPDDWRDDILALQKQGRIEEARRELHALRAAHPDYPVRFPGLE